MTSMCETLEYLTYIAEVLREARPMLVLVGTVSCANCFHGCLLERRRSCKRVITSGAHDPERVGGPSLGSASRWFASDASMHEPISSERGESSNGVSLGGYTVRRTLSFFGFCMGGGAPNRTHT